MLFETKYLKGLFRSSSYSDPPSRYSQAIIRFLTPLIPSFPISLHTGCLWFSLQDRKLLGSQKNTPGLEAPLTHWTEDEDINKIRASSGGLLILSQLSSLTCLFLVQLATPTGHPSTLSTGRSATSGNGSSSAVTSTSWTPTASLSAISTSAACSCAA